jgi:hypothetical protein
VEGMIAHPEAAVVKGIQVKVLDARGAVRASQLSKL